MSPWKLADRYSLDELHSMLQNVISDPDSLNTNQSSCLRFSKKAQRKLDAIGEAISLHQKNRKIADGTYETSGYSGRISNRR